MDQQELTYIQIPGGRTVHEYDLMHNGVWFGVAYCIDRRATVKIYSSFEFEWHFTDVAFANKYNRGCETSLDTPSAKFSDSIDNFISSLQCDAQKSFGA